MVKKETEGEIIKQAWPTKAAMEQIYAMKLWGDNKSDFYSGNGSHDPEIVKPYLDSIISFLTSFPKQLVVCDFGCGDFNVGKEFVKYSQNYIAVDIVLDLINRNKEKFKAENLVFQCLDIAVDDLPQADCVLIRQVLQHLSNTEIQQIVLKLNVFKYVILTEHLPEGEFVPNKEIISGQGIRLKRKSGLNLLVEPFNLKVEEAKELLSIPLGDGKGVITTSLFRMF